MGARASTRLRYAQLRSNRRPRGVLSKQHEEAVDRHYLDDLLYTHGGDARTGPDHVPVRNNIVAAFEGYGLSIELQPFECEGTICYNVIATQVGLVHPEVYYIKMGPITTRRATPAQRAMNS
jgi:hypothetical protein